MFLPGRLAWTVPVGALLISDLFLNAHYGVSLMSWSMPIVYACYVLAVFIGTKLRGAGLLALLGATVGNAIVFYLVTNTLAWLGKSPVPANLRGADPVADHLVFLAFRRPGRFSAIRWRGDLISRRCSPGRFYLARNRSAEPNLCRQESSLLTSALGLNGPRSPRPVSAPFSTEKSAQALVVGLKLELGGAVVEEHPHAMREGGSTERAFNSPAVAAGPAEISPNCVEEHAKLPKNAAHAHRHVKADQPAERASRRGRGRLVPPACDSAYQDAG